MTPDAMDPLDTRIQAALAVNPSPEFMARVRTRVAAEPAPSVWRWSWTFAAAGAMAAVAAIAFVLSPAHEKTTLARVTPAGPPAVARTPSDTPAAGDVAQVFRPAVAEPTTRRIAIARLKPRARAAPEILFDRREVAALRRLIAGVRDGWVDLSALQLSGSLAPMETEPIRDIVIAPITIDPIAPVSGAEGVRP